MRVPGQKFFVPAIKKLAGMARSYNYVVLMRSKFNFCLGHKHDTHLSPV
jgi:hypothetical protein